MLKVNTAKISVEEFAKKYGLVIDFISSAYSTPKCANASYDFDKDRLLVDEKTGFISIFGSFYPFSLSFYVRKSFEELDVLYDMISNGDVIKE
jgi:hypothetical protein